MAKQEEKKVPIVRHIMADGTILYGDEIKDYKFDINEFPPVALRIITEMMMPDYKGSIKLQS